MKRTLALVVTGLWLSACIDVTLALGNPHRVVPIEQHRVGMINMRWHRQMADTFSLDWRPVFHGAPVYDPARHVVYVGSIDSGLYALRASDGESIWRFQTLGIVDSTPAVDGDLVFFGSRDGALYAIDAGTGRMRWRFPTTASIYHPALVYNNTVFFVNGNDAVLALSRSDGSLRWRYRRNSPGGISLSGHAGLTRLDGHLFTAFSDGNVVCLDADDGSVVWTQDTSEFIENVDERNEAHQPIDVDTTPLIIRDNVYVASFTAGVFALDTTNGTQHWRDDNVLHVAGLGTDGQYLFAASAVSGLVKIDPYDGSVQWARDLGSSAIMAPTRASEGVLAVPTGDTGLWMVRSADGAILDGLRPGSGFTSAPSLWGNQAFAASNAGVLYSFQVRGQTRTVVQ